MASTDPPHRQSPDPWIRVRQNPREEANRYDDDARESGWSGPAVVFSLAFACVTPGVPGAEAAGRSEKTT